MSNPKNNNMLVKLIILGAIVAIVVIYFNSDMRKRMQNATNNVISKTNEQEKSLPLPPTKDEVSKLIKENMQHFAISVNQKDMSVFYKNISTFWQNKTTIKDLNKAFEPFINSGINLTVLKNYETDT